MRPGWLATLAGLTLSLAIGCSFLTDFDPGRISSDGGATDATADSQGLPDSGGPDGPLGPPCANSGQCDDGNKCTADFCNLVTGRCEFPPKNCADSFGCTVDRCDMATGDCVHEPRDSRCNDGKSCTTDTCSPSAGCVNAPDDNACADSDPCTEDRCQPSSGSSGSDGCRHRNISNCHSCNQTSDCPSVCVDCGLGMARHCDLQCSPDKVCVVDSSHCATLCSVACTP